MTMQASTTPYETARPNRAGYRDITPEAAVAAKGKARLVDVREASELAFDGFIPGVEHVPMGKIESAARAWDKEEEIILICRSGNRSAGIAELLTRRGFKRVMNMVGGMMAYSRTRLPIARQ